MDTTMSTELQMLFCAIALGIVQLLISVLASVGAKGLPWAAGPRDDPGAPMGKMGGRMPQGLAGMMGGMPPGFPGGRR